MFSSIQNIEEYLQELVPKTTQLLFTGDKGVARTKEYLSLLGSPQNQLKVIHVAGTSGKGSTSFMISKLLESQGFSVGLHLSPHLIDIRERMMINNELISEKKFVSYFNKVFIAIEKMKHSSLGVITYFEALVGLAYFVFTQEKVNYAVMETGLGGEFDGTNIVERQDKLAVITKIGFDHTKILGNTLSKIAHQKAMICAEKGELITIQQYPSAQREIAAVVKNKIGTLIISQKREGIDLGLLGEYQKENASLALAVLSHMSKRDGFTIQMNFVRSVFASLRFKGRFDVIQKKGGVTILDGAHNTQKMKAFLNSVSILYPNKKFTFVIAFKQGKEYRKMLKYIISYANKIYITHIFSGSQDILHQSITSQSIIAELQQMGFTAAQILDTKEEVAKIIQREDESCIVTGSLYLLGDVYKLVASD